MIHLAELANEPWLMEQAALEALVARAQNAPESRMRDDATGSALPVRFADGVATVEMRGVMMTRAPWWADGVVITGEVARAVERLAADPTVRSIVMVVDSPGGHASGVQDLADVVRAAAAVKPVHAVVDGMAASAAYYAVSGATKITATAGSRLGSIGTYLVAVDGSRLAENMGVKVHVVRSGEEKGIGTFGAPLTEQQLGTLQRMVDELTGDFVAAVAQGRRMPPEKVKGLATGRVWRASEAVAQGLADGVAPVATALSNIVKTTREKFMADQKDIDAARAEEKAAEKARRKAILAAFPDDQAFALEQIESDATLQEAKVAYCDHLQEQAKAKDAAHAAELAAARKGAQATTQASGTKPVPHGDASSGDAGDFMAQARARAKDLQARGVKQPMTTAMRELIREQPELYRAYREGVEPVKLADALPELQDRQRQVNRIKR